MGTVLIIGAGAAGLTAAIFAAREGAGVILLEHNAAPGRKLLATGNGRCNLTNVRWSPDCWHSQHPKIAWAVLEKFPLADTLRFFSGLGIYTQNRNDGLYPKSGQAASVLSVLRMEAEQLGVKLKTNAHVSAIRRQNGRFFAVTDGWTYEGDALILSTGSKASEVPGSGESGYELSASLGLSLVEPLPALSPLVCRGKGFSKWAGVRIEGVLTLYTGKEIRAREAGELQLTSYGVSGIPAFQASHLAAKDLQEGREVTLSLDFFPDFTEEELRSYLQRRRKECPYKNSGEQLIGLFPEKLIPVLLGGKDLVQSIKAFPLKVQKVRSFCHAQVCSGGVSLSEISPDTLEAWKIPGLYLAGEILDVDGLCGGYNLQWAWSSGALSGRAAGRRAR